MGTSKGSRAIAAIVGIVLVLLAKFIGVFVVASFGLILVIIAVFWKKIGMDDWIDGEP